MELRMTTYWRESQQLVVGGQDTIAMELRMTTYWRESQQLVVLAVTVLKPAKTSKVLITKV